MGRCILRGEVVRSQVNKLSDSPQRIPQYIEVPPNIEGKQIASCFSTVLFYQSNPLLLKDDFKLTIFSGLLAGHLHFLIVAVVLTRRVTILYTPGNPEDRKVGWN